MSLLEQIPITELHQPYVLKNRRYDIDLKIDDITALPIDQLAAIIALMRDENPSEALEIGTNSGCTTRWLSKAMPSCTIHTLDLPVDWTHGGMEKSDMTLIQANRISIGQAFREGGFPNIRQHYGDSATFDFKSIGAPTFFFIDGSHNYHYILNDTEKCMGCAKDGHGSIVWHDCAYGHDEVVRALIHLRETKKLQIYRIGYGLAWCRF